ncbi:uncharacterized protein LOC113336580 [Papaver somniferum]|uniref:uncharacterized protein LOC113336580 n=1 Tax=Papaver somniferum TaxID=3469 RepID=UPI000E6FB00E|nr:uncharacterized protein LOC113336580 [Papaver somniferum]XP_026438052.1 uncharacterized protein LOC113336580 [Papaver somniferum]
MMESEPFSLVDGVGLGLGGTVFLVQGTTIIMIKCIDGILVATDGLIFKVLADKEEDAGQKKSDALDTRAYKVEYIGDPPFMLTTASGTTVWFRSMLESLKERMKGKEWNIEKCADHAKTVLSQKSFTPKNCEIPKDVNIMDYGCTILFARYAPNPNQPASMIPCIMLVRKDEIEDIKEPYICVGSGSGFAKTLLEGKDFSNWKKEVVVRFLEETMVLISKKDVRTGGDIAIYYISSNNSISPVYQPFKSVVLLEMEHNHDKERQEMAEAKRASKRSRKTERAPKKKRKTWKF